MFHDSVSTLSIKTPEGVEFSLPLAGPVPRFLAWLIDLAFISAASSVIAIPLKILAVISLDLSYALSILAYFVLSIGYGIVLEWFWRGQTLGKRVLKLRVVDERGLRLRFSQIAIRNLLRFVDSLPAFYLLGGAACLLSQNCQRLGDFAANTVVIWHQSVSMPDIDQLQLSKYNSFRDYPHLAARLRQKVTPAQASIALHALMRRNELEPQARIAVFREVASRFQQVVVFPDHVMDGLSDEQYVRNLVEVLYHR
ncbi:MAG TPA: RDD family protein [Thermodesulfovibrionia bacterium]|nr:RDD family protein [Thermodesulfovibrionia bacterium]